MAHIAIYQARAELATGLPTVHFIRSLGWLQWRTRDSASEDDTLGRLSRKRFFDPLSTVLYPRYHNPSAVTCASPCN
jgi:hypothetical protein